VSDENPARPGWPGSAPPPTSEPTPDAVARPSWDRAAATGHRTVDLKLVIAVLIGLVSVTGAAVAWQSAIAGEKATDKDRQAVAETVTVEQSRADSEIILQDARARFSQHAIDVVNAGLLEQQAESASAAGDDDRAATAADEAVELRAVATRVLEGGLGPVLLAEYVTEGADGERPTFDEARLSADLDRIASAQNQLDPVQTIREADRLRRESERFDRWLIFIVGAVVLLTVAQISKRKPLRLALTAAGTSVWLVTTVLAFSGS
jgi:hypothetical protein